MYIKLFILIYLILSNNILAKPISFKDQTGQNITLLDTPKRIVTIASPAGSMVIAMSNNKKCLVGTSFKSYKAIMEGVLNEFFPYLNNISSSFLSKENSINIETLLQLKPDLVLQWAHNEKSIALLKDVGLTVVGMKYSKLDIARRWLSDIAFMLNNSNKAKKVLKWHDETYKKIISKTKNIDNKNRPSVLYLINEDLAAGSFSHFQFFMDTAGAKNAMNIKKKFINFDAEMLLLANPEIIWLSGFNMRLTPDTIYKNPIFSEIKAVKNKRVYKVPVGGDRWDPPNQELALSLEWFTRTVHSKLLDGSIRYNIKKAYSMLYGEIPNEEQLDLILRKQINKNAINYNEVIK